MAGHTKMAQTGFTPISLYYTTTAAAVPTAGNLVAGELAINTQDGKLFYKDAAGVVQTIASKAGALGDVVGPASATDNALARFDATTGKLIQNSVGILSDAGALTGITDFTYTGTLTGGTGVVNLGSGQFYKDASGNVLIGNSTDPLNSNKLLVQSSGTTNNNRTFSVYNTSASSTTAFANRLVQISSLGSGADATLQFTDQVANNAYFGMGSGALYFATGGTTERMRIDSSGNLLVGQTARGIVNSNSFNIDVSSVTMYYNHVNGTATGQSYAEFGYNTSVIGSIKQTGTTAVLYNTTSDYRLKTNVTPIQNALSVVEALNPVSFTWVDGRKDDGFLAHEIQSVIANCVTGEKDAVNENGTPKYQQMDSSGVIPFLVKAIQEQQALITDLTTRLTALENK